MNVAGLASVKNGKQNLYNGFGVTHNCGIKHILFVIRYDTK